MAQSLESAAAPTRRRRRRLIWLASCGALLILGTLLYRHYWHSHPMGSGPAGPEVASSDFSETWSERRVLLVGLGDSVTAGYGAPGGHGYFDRLKQNPRDEFPEMQGVSLSSVFPNLVHQNLSISGSTSLECLDSILPRLERQDADTFGVVVITTGGNDIIHNYGRTPPREGAMYGSTLEQARPWIASFAERLEAICDGIDERFPGGCQIFLANIYDPTDGVGDAFNAGLPPWSEGLALVAAYNGVIAETASRRPNVHLVDMHGLFLGHGIHCLKFWSPHYHPDDPHYWYWENLEDPNDRGYDALRRSFLIEMARVLPEALREMPSTEPDP
ncbi:MAG: SGNH/GDSL hydrolase family protein [Planctomycetales bacterium]